MSGQPYKTSYDIANAREAYLANLKLRAEIDDKNLQANKTYIKTGQLPVEPTDTRTLTEKLADVERLKIDIRSKLLEITDGTEAGKIVEQLTPDELVFLSQQWTPIKDQIKRTYSVGVLADIFVDYLRRFIDKFNLTRGVELGLQQSSVNQLLANQRTIMRQMINANDLSEVYRLVADVGLQNTQLGREIKNDVGVLKTLIELLPTTFEIMKNADDPILINQMSEIVNNIVRDLPTRADVSVLIDRASREKEARDINAMMATFARLEQLLTSGQDIIEEIQVLRQLIMTKKPMDVPQELRPVNQPIVAEAKVVEQDIPIPATTLGRDIKADYKSVESVNGKASELQTKYEIKSYIVFIYEKYLLKNELGKTYTQFANDVTGDTRGIQTDLTDLKKIARAMNKIFREKMYGEDTPFILEKIGRGMSGKGIARARPSQVFSSDIDYSQGIKPSAKFVPIGRYLINKRQLDKDIVAIKRPAGSTIPNLPSQRVSRNFGSVMRKIIGGAIPTFDELNSLSDDERVYLHKVAKETRIDDKLSIPTPKKDEDEKDINQFEILKGQILSGNDNIELVKKFKTIILKLSKKDLIPKAQVKDLLLDLATLGH
jgi:hypothetical protein